MPYKNPNGPGSIIIWISAKGRYQNARKNVPLPKKKTPPFFLNMFKAQRVIFHLPPPLPPSLPLSYLSYPPNALKIRYHGRIRNRANQQKNNFAMYIELELNEKKIMYIFLSATNLFFFFLKKKNLHIAKQLREEEVWGINSMNSYTAFCSFSRLGGGAFPHQVDFRIFHMWDLFSQSGSYVLIVVIKNLLYAGGGKVKAERAREREIILW